MKPSRNWNDKSSIPIRNLTPEELKEAIHEWAEGSEELEELLWLCHDHKVVTLGCHVSKSGNGCYIEFDIEDADREYLKKIVYYTYLTGWGRLVLHFGANPRSGPDWYKPTISVSTSIPYPANRLFKNLIEVFRDGKKTDEKAPFLKIFELYEVAKRKSIPLLIRLKNYDMAENIIYAEDHVYTSIDNPISEAFAQAGLKRFSQSKRDEGLGPLWYGMSYGDENLEKDLDTLIKCIENLQVNIDSSHLECLRNGYLLRAKRFEFPLDDEGDAQFMAWFKKHPEL
jgi:hypothetical protein